MELENFYVASEPAVDDVADVVVAGGDGDGELLPSSRALDDVADVVAGGDGRCWRTST